VVKMEEKLPEIIFASSDSSTSKRIRHQLDANRIRKLIPRVYTSNFSDDDEVIIDRNKWIIIGHLFPGAILSHRSALEGGPTPDGHIFLTYKQSKNVKYPGLTVHLLSGPSATDQDMDFISDLKISSNGRRYLENLQRVRDRGSVSKALDRSIIEDRLDSICRIRGEDQLNQLREEARILAKELDMEEEFQRLTSIISAILTTHPADELESPLAKARAQGQPYDPHRLALFDILFRELQQTTLPCLLTTQYSEHEGINFAFFDAYFSNYIEGTVFELEEAREIIFERQKVQQRPTDAHDILSTFLIVSNPNEMNQLSQDYESYQNLLQSRHLTIMDMRPEKAPGRFKLKTNRAGMTHFVEPAQVKGTLLKGWEMMQGLSDPLSRAIFQMFLVSEVHPFDDGNGRIARIMMNAELEQAGLQKIMIPTVYREDYLLALQALSRSQRPDPLVKMLIRVQQFSSEISFENWEVAVNDLTRCKAFEESNDARLVLLSEMSKTK